MQVARPTTESKSGTKKRSLFVGLSVKLIVAFTLLFAVVFGGAYYWFYNFSTESATNRLRDDLDTLLKGVSTQIDGDQFLEMVEEADVREDGYSDDERYWDHARFLFQMSSIDPRARFYTYTRGDDPDEVRFIGSDGALEDPPIGVTFKQDYVFPPEDAAVILGGLDKTVFYLDIYEDEFGSWISGYTPIVDDQGQVVGALGCDFRADYVREVQQKIKDAIIPAFGVTAIFLIIMVYAASKILTRPVVALTRIAAHIGEGDYNQDLSSLTRERFPDEISILANVFEIMVGKVRQREEKLRQQVSDLQIMIDEGRRQQQVEEIVETDFFRDLRTKARAMRAGFEGSPD